MVVKVHTLDNMTPEKRAEYDARQAKWEAEKSQRDMEALRYERDVRLAATDWAALPDSPHNTQELLDYRHALRDIPQQYASLDDVVWPVNPLEV